MSVDAELEDDAAGSFTPSLHPEPMSKTILDQVDSLSNGMSSTADPAAKTSRVRWKLTSVNTPARIPDDFSSQDGLSTVFQPGSASRDNEGSICEESTLSTRANISTRQVPEQLRKCRGAAKLEHPKREIFHVSTRKFFRVGKVFLVLWADQFDSQVESPQQAYPSADRPRVVRETRLPATLNGHEISAIPDVGAAANFIALRYVRSHGLTINSTAHKLVRTAVGSAVDILGTVTLPFSFRDEGKIHHLNFNVMREAVHDVIIGSPFLKLTKTYTQYKHRLQQMLRKVRLPRLRFLGSHQYVSGQVNGTYVDAVPDTGADIPVMSLSFAKEHGFAVDTSPEHHILLQFADESTAATIGMVRDMNWSFGSSETQHQIDVYVLKDLQTDLILDNTFLYDTNAFVTNQWDFWTANSDVLGDGWMISIIKLVDQVLRCSRWTSSSNSSTNPAASSDEAWRVEKSRQLSAYSLARKHAEGMTEDQRVAFLQPHLAQGRQFLESHPGHSAASQSIMSPTTSSISTQAGVSAPTVVPTTAKHSNFFRKLRVFK